MPLETLGFASCAESFGQAEAEGLTEEWERGREDAEGDYAFVHISHGVLEACLRTRVSQRSMPVGLILYVVI
jgi:hypothetical protein